MKPDAIDVLALPHVSLHRRSDLPPVAAVYFVLQGDTILYIGRATCLQQRWMAHHQMSGVSGKP